MDALELIVISTLVAMAGVIIGSKVQRLSRFIYPTDFMTISLFALICADLIVGFTGLDPYWYLPLALGYAVGYLVVGRTVYIMVWQTSLATKHVEMGPWVTWEESGRVYLQEQKNIALFRRLVLGIKHEVVSDVPLTSDWTVEAKYPLFPLFSKPTVVTEDVYVTVAEEHVIWRVSAKRYTTHVSLAYAGTVSKLQLAQDEHYLKAMQKQNVQLINTVHDLTSQQGPMLMEMALKLEQSVDATAPVNRMYDLIAYGSRTKKKEKKEESSNGNTEAPAENES